MEVNTAPAKKSRLTLYIILALVIGVLVGFGLNKMYVNEENAKIANFDLALKDFKEQIKVEKDSATLAGYQATVKTM
ncbi:MAG: hypothetical protein O9262_12325, partial [Cyclobacteriaceae bacterium]|nr:hypothetical protein [Cyclobacteriaceae bacterium]